MPCVYFAFPAVLGLFKKNNDDDGYKQSRYWFFLLIFAPFHSFSLQVPILI